MQNKEEYVRARRWQSVLAGLAANEADILNGLLDMLHDAELPKFEGTSEEFRAVDKEVRISEEFDRMNAELKRIIERRGRDGLLF